MQGSKRRNVDEFCDDIKTKRLQEYSFNSVTKFEDLSTEIIYEIFEYIDSYLIYKSFFNLNQHFHNLLIYSILPIEINTSFISKSSFQHHCKHIIIPNKHRIITLELLNPFSIDFVLSSTSKFIRLKRLSLTNIKSEYLYYLLPNLTFLSNLSSLIINPGDHIEDENTFYLSIFRLPVLKYCKVSFDVRVKSTSLPFATTKFSPIEHLIINNDCDFNQFFAVLSYVPQLRRLHYHSLTQSPYTYITTEAEKIVLKHLTHLDIQFRNLPFSEFKRIISNSFPQLEVLHISTDSIIDFLYSIPNLRILDIQGVVSITDSWISLASNLFCIKRKWSLAYQRFYSANQDQGFFYSTSPYRRKYYTLYGKTYSANQKENFTSVRSLQIEKEQAIIDCIDYFPNVTELTLSHGFQGNYHSLSNNLNRILPLIQLTKLNIHCEDFGFKELIKLLRVTPNLHTLKIYSIKIDSMLLEECITYRNLIQNVTVDKWCKLEEIKFLVNLCSQLKCLTIDIIPKDFESIVQFLLTKNNPNTRHLVFLCLKNVKSVMVVKRLKILIQHGKLLDDYSIELIRSKLYLWW